MGFYLVAELRKMLDCRERKRRRVREGGRGMRPFLRQKQELSGSFLHFRG